MKIQLVKTSFPDSIVQISVYINDSRLRLFILFCTISQNVGPKKFQFCCTLFWRDFSLNPDFVHKKSFWPEGVNTPLLFGNPSPYMASTLLFIFFPSHSLLSTFFDNAPVKYPINTKIMAKLFLHFRRL